MERRQILEQRNTKVSGRNGELKAAEFLERQGCSILEKNFSVRSGEIDIIYLDEDTICFGEVKYRKTDKNGSGEEAVNYKKQRQISRTSDYYRMENELSEELSYRFDVIAITDSEIKWLKNAFYYIPRRN